MKIYIIRHGQTYCNEKRLYCGKEDVHLSENGILSLNKLRKEFYYPLSDLYFTSGAKRANETLEILFPEVFYKEKKKFWEYNFGEFELKSYNDLKENDEYIKWILDKEGAVYCPNGECRIDFNKRIKNEFKKFIYEIKGKNIESVCLITHGGVIVSILSEFMEQNNSNFYELQPSCGQGYELDVKFYDENIKVVIKNKIPMKR